MKGGAIVFVIIIVIIAVITLGIVPAVSVSSTIYHEPISPAGRDFMTSTPQPTPLMPTMPTNRRLHFADTRQERIYDRETGTILGDGVGIL